jgi:hypothetical protein
MTKSQAEKLLKKPRFGDPECIKAVERLEQEPEIKWLRKLLVGKYTTCPACGDDSSMCDVCKNDGRVQITKQLANSWDLDILRDVAREMELEVEDE